MKSLIFSTVEELEEFERSLGRGYLFRGQTREYADANGFPSIPTSFKRHGCIPSVMTKWYFYSRIILERYVKGFDPAADLATDQAILQHYGWRSFFVDATSDFGVACWFSCNKYNEKRAIELREDCWEDPVWAVHDRAWYEPSDDEAVLYVLAPKAIRAHNLQMVDLVEITIATGRPRFLAQSAFMVGPLDDNLPVECIHYKISAPAKIFHQHVTKRQDLSTELLIPRPGDDPVLASLIALPWVKIPARDDDESGIEVFRRGLPLPEYAPVFERRSNPNTAYYRRFWTCDFPTDDHRFSDVYFYLADEGHYHGIATDRLTFPHLSRLLHKQPCIVFEIDGLASQGGGTQYAKGIYLEMQNDGRILLTELAVEYIGARPANFGIIKGKYYEVNESCEWIVTEHPDTCDCGNELHHAHHLVVANHFEYQIAKNGFQIAAERRFYTRGVSPKSDPIAIEAMKAHAMEMAAR